MSGPLAGIRIVEMAAIGPVPFGGMLLADLGADILRIDRVEAIDLGVPLEPRFDVMARGRRSLALDLKRPDSVAIVLALAEKADALIEGFRPGVMERLGIGPETCLQRNPKLVYGRMTGWGQTGPLADTAGHDIDYIALSGALHAIGRDGPVPPLNLIGDFGGGGVYLALGVVSALLEARASGKGQVVDAAMTDGAASLMAMIYGRLAAGKWTDRRADNVLDGASPWYDVYETADGRHMAVGAIEARFYAELVRRLGLEGAKLPAQHDRAGWPALREAFAARFRTKTRDEWCAVFEDADACVAPVLSLAEAPRDAHNRARGTFIERDGVAQPAPAPRFSRTPGAVSRSAPQRGEGGAAALAEWGFPAEAIAGFRARGAVFE